MRTVTIAALAVTLVAGSALGQNANPPASSRPNNPALSTTGKNNSENPVAGANSFTRGQAKARIEKRGYTNVSGLKKDDSGVWQGKAAKDGKPVSVSIDFQGNVIGR